MKSIKYIITLVVAASLLFSYSSCSKHTGYYDFENKENQYAGSTLDYFRSKPGTYDSLLLVLDLLPEFKEGLASDSLTIFAPTNASFRLAITNLNLVRKTQNRSDLNLKTLNRVELDTLLSKYIVQGLKRTADMEFVDGLDMTTSKYEKNMHAQRIKQDASGHVGGGLVTVYYTDKKDSKFELNWVRAATQAVNISTDKSVVHVLANGHEFGFGDFLTKMNK